MSHHKNLAYIFTQMDLNMRQRQWLKYLVDCNFELRYHSGKENVVADGLSRKDRITLASIMVREWKMLESIVPFDLDLMLAKEKFQPCSLVV